MGSISPTGEKKADPTEDKMAPDTFTNEIVESAPAGDDQDLDADAKSDGGGGVAKKGASRKGMIDLENDPDRDHPDYEALHSPEDLLDQDDDSAEATTQDQPGSDDSNSAQPDPNAGWNQTGWGQAGSAQSWEVNTGAPANGASSNQPGSSNTNGSDPSNPFKTVDNASGPEDEEDAVFSRLDNVDDDADYEARLQKHFALEFQRHFTDTIISYRQTQPYQIYPVNEKNEIVDEDKDGNQIHAELLLNINDFQNYFELRAKREVPDGDSDADIEHVDGSDPSNPIVESFASDTLAAKYPFKTLDTYLWEDKDDTLGVQIVNLKDLRTAAGPAAKFFASLPARTVERITEMTGSDDEDAFLCTIVHREKGMLDKNIYYNVSAWGQETASILTARETRFIIEGSADVEEAIVTFVEHLNRKKYQYMVFHDREKKGRLRYIKDKMQPPGFVDLSSKAFNYPGLLQFQDLHEFATFSFVFAQESIHILDEHAFNFQIGVHSIIIIPTDGVQDRSIQAGFFKVERPAEGVKPYFPRDGDMIQISFDIEETWDTRKEDRTSQIWNARFCQPFTVDAPRGWHPILVTRKWDGKAAAFDSFEPEITGTTTMLPQKLEAAIQLSEGQNVRAKLITDTKDLSNIKWQVDRLTNAAQDDPKTEYNDRINEVILGTRLDKLKREDYFEDPVAELGSDVLKEMNLDVDQVKAIEMTRNAIGGVTFVQGPPGTGKSHLAKESLIPSLLCQKTPQQTVILCPTNLTASRLAQEVDRMIKEKAKSKPHLGGKYVVRVYSQAAERRYRDLSALQAREANPKVEKKRQPRPDALVPDIDEAFDDLPEVSQSIISLIQASRFRPTHGVPDIRFTNPELSVAHYMLKFVGLIPGEAALPEYKEKHRLFVNYYRRWSRGGFLSKMQIQDFGLRGDKLFQDILKNASVIVSTTSGIASRRVLQVIESVTTSMVFEENPKEAEINLLPVFAARFKKNPKMLFIGDHLQLPPQATIPYSQLALSRQVQIAFMTRMIAVGHPYVLLTKNYRMAPGIAEIINTYFYQGRLVNDESVLQKQRPLQGPFKNFVNQKFQKGYLDTILLATASEGKNITTVNRSTKSRSNHFHINIALQLIEPLLSIVDSDTDNNSAQEGSDSAKPKSKHRAKREPPSIAIVTMYEDQRMLYSQAVLQMRLKGVPHIENLHVVNTDASQGVEYDYVFVDLSLSQEAGFTSDPKRPNVALSRARDGLVVIADIGQISKMKGAQILKDIKNHYVKRGHYYEVKSDKYIASPYFQPKEIKRAAAKRANPRGMIQAYRSYKPENESTKGSSSPVSEQLEIDETPSTAPPQSPVKPESAESKPKSPGPKSRDNGPGLSGAIETSEGLVYLHLAPEDVYDQCFPSGFDKLTVTGEGRLCVPRAAAASWNAQYDLVNIKAQELIAIATDPSNVDRWSKKFNNPNADHWHIEMLQDVFNDLLQAKGLDYEIQIGYISDLTYEPQIGFITGHVEAGLELAPAPIKTRLLLWLHSDNAALTGEVVVNHFSGVRSKAGYLPKPLESISQPWHKTVIHAAPKSANKKPAPPKVEGRGLEKTESVTVKPKSDVDEPKKTKVEPKAQGADSGVPKSELGDVTTPKESGTEAGATWDVGRNEPEGQFW